MNYIVIHSINSLGGAERVLQKILAEFSYTQYTIVTLEKRLPGKYYEEFNCLNIISLSKESKVNVMNSLLLIYRFIKSIDPLNDKIIGFLWRAYLPIAIISLFMKLGTKSFYIMEHLVPEHYSNLFNRLLKFCFKQARHVYFVSKYALEEFDVSNGEVLYNYLDVPTKAPVKTSNGKVIWIGRNCYQKNIGDLMSFAKINYELTFDVFGFQEREFIDTPNNIKIKGKVNQIDYSEYEYLLITSHYESQALVVHEALSNGLSVICREGLYPFIKEFYPKHTLLLYDKDYRWSLSQKQENYFWNYNNEIKIKWEELLTK